MLRAREKDLLLRALGDIRDWEAALDQGKLDFQLSKIKAFRAAERAAQERRREIREQAIQNLRAQEGGDGLVLARVPCSDLVDAQGAMLPETACGGGAFEVRRGRSLEDDLNAYRDQWKLTHAEAKQLGYQALEAVRLNHSARALLVWQPVVLQDGNMSVLSVREGEDAVFASQVFLAVHAEQHNLTFDPEAERRLEHWISEQARIRSMRKVLLALNISAPDGRQLELKLRQGDQHELSYILGHWAEAEGLGRDVAANLASQLEARLPPKVKDFNIPAGQFVTGQRELNLRLSQGDVLTEVVPIFCDVYRIPQQQAPAIMDSIKNTLGL